jgi:hypothetical protein
VRLHNRFLEPPIGVPCLLTRYNAAFACARPGSGRPPATPPKKFPFLRKTPRKVQINHPLPYKKRIKEMQSTVMQDVRRSTLLHSQRVAEARAAAGEEVCGAFDSMVDGVITQAEIERR